MVPTVERGTAAGGLLFDGDGGAQAVDRIDVGPLHLVEKLARVGGKRLHIAALAFGVDGVEGQRGFPGAAQAGDHGEAVAGNLDVDVLQVVLARAMHGDPVQHNRLWEIRWLFYCRAACPVAANCDINNTNEVRAVR